MFIDNNKSITNIAFNFLNLPQQVDVASKGSINYIYDATGNKLKKVTVDNTVSPSLTTTTLYTGAFVYQNDTLQFINQEEGRIRWVKHNYLNGTNAWGFEYDYFLKDHLGNVRMVLTQQKDTSQYIATMEAAYKTNENKLFYNLPASNYARALVSGYPTDPTTTPNDSLMRLNGSGQKVGAAIILKVMSGDVVDIAVKAYYNSQTYNAPNNSVVDALNSLANGIFAVTTGAKGTLPELNNTVTSPLYSALQSFINGNNPTVPNKPRAHLNWMLLDEQFQYVSSYPQSGALAVGNFPSNTLNTLAYTGIPITKNGFLYIYVNNETPGWDVFFDNMSIKHYTGPILEETHYYPFGLVMSGISSKAAGGLENKRKWNKGSELESNEFSDGGGLELYSTFYRSLDPQIGRFWQIDPKPDFSQSLYSAMNNNPISFNDPLGDTVRVDKTITDNKLLNSSFNAFAATKEGRKFLAKYASKGQTIGGMTFNKDGKLSKKGIDLNYNAQSITTGAEGYTSKSIGKDGRGEITVTVDSDFYGKTVDGLVKEAFGKIGTFFHESFIHADLYSKDYLDNKQFDHSNISNDVKNAAGYPAHYQHYQVLMDYMKNGYNTSNLWPGAAFNGLKQLNDILKAFPTDQKLLTDMWDYSGGVQLDENGKVKH